MKMNSITAPEHRDVVLKQITAWREAGVTWISITNKLKKAGYAKPSGTPLDLSCVKYLVKTYGGTKAAKAEVMPIATVKHTNTAQMPDFKNEIKELLAANFSAETKLKLISALV